MSWDQVYQDSESVWGEQPDVLLTEIAPLVPRGRVLDLGMGEGRNGMFYAQQGYDVRGIDTSSAAVARCRAWAEALRVPFEAEVGDIRDVVIEPDSLALAICAMSLQFVKQSESQQIMQRIRQGLSADGIVYITTFSTDDPGFARSKRTRPEVEKNTFLVEAENRHIHYFEKDELLSVFSGLTLHHFSQTLLLDGGHPGAPEPHYHGTLTYIGQKEMR